MRFKYLPIVVLIFAVSRLQAEPLAGPPLADTVPAGVLIYVGWAGTDSLQQAYDGSHLKAVISQSNLPELARENLPKLIDKFFEMNGDQSSAEPAKKLLPMLWHHPAAIYMQSIDAKNPDKPPIFGFICNAGTDAQAIADALHQMAKDDPTIHIDIRKDNQVFLSNGAKEADAPADSLVNSDKFKTATKGFLQSPALCLYLDGTGIITAGNDLAEHSGNTAWPKIRDALGIENFQSIAMAEGFEGKDWARSSFLAAPLPRAGLLAVIEPKAIDPAVLARIPASMDSVSVIDFDAGKLFDAIHAAMNADPQTASMFDKFSGTASMMLGRNLRAQILGSLGSQWIACGDAAGKLHLLINQVADAKVAQDALVSMSYAISNLANSQMFRGKAVTVASQEQLEGLTITKITFPQGAICWVIKDGLFFLSNKPATIATVANAVPPEKNITQSDAFVSARARLGLPADTVITFDYANLPASIPTNVAGMNTGLDRLRKMFSLPQIVLPSSEQLMAEVYPAMNAKWADKDGIHSKSVNPFPGSFVLGNPQSSMTSLGGVALMTSILLPSLNRARETTNRVKCASDERQVGIAMAMYLNDHKGMYPPDLGTLVKEKYVTLDMFICPSGDTKKPANADKMTPDELAAWVNEYGDYVYLGKGRVHHDSPSQIIMYEKGHPHGGDGMNMLYGDDHVEFQRAAEAKRLLDEQSDKGGGL